MKPLSQPKPAGDDVLNRATIRQTQKRLQAEAILRDLAFVLKMTQRVHEEIVAEKESEAYVIA